MDQNTIYFVLVLAGTFILFQWWKKQQMTDSNTIASALAQGAIVVDVRSPEEFSGGHYPGASNVPLHLLAISVDAIGAKKDQAIILYCASGMRSANAKRILEAAGYQNVMNAGSQGNIPRR